MESCPSGSRKRSGWSRQIRLFALLAGLSMRCGPTLSQPPAQADATSDAGASTAYKLTLSHYLTEVIRADDINLRVNRENQTGWIGFYREAPTEFQQVRGGYERTDQWLAAQLVTSLQAASRGFVGGAVTLQIGDPWFAVLGFGRTNLKPYANLNFDPNDAITFGAGWHKPDGMSVSIFAVRDDRVMPGQQVTHLVLRSPLPSAQRLTLDLFDKRGPAEEGLSIRGSGASLTYDWPSVFVRLAHDPKVNFSQETMTRIAVGMRF